MYQRHALLLICKSILDGAADQALRSRRRHGLDAYAGIPANLLLTVFQHFVVQEFEEFFRFRGAGFPLDADVNVFGILAEDEHVHFFRLANRRRHTLKIAHGSFAGIEIQELPQRDVQRAYTASDWSGKGAFDSHTKIADRLDRIIRQPFVEGLERFLAGENFEPSHAAFAAISVLHGRIEHPPRRFPDVSSRAISFNERNNRSVRHLQLAAAVADRLALGGNNVPVIRTLHEYGSLE